MIKRSMRRTVSLEPEHSQEWDRMGAMTTIPPLLRHHHTDEFVAPPWSHADRRALDQIASTAEHAASCLGLDARAYVEHRCGTAATLRALDAEAGGGFYAVPPDAEHGQAAADAAL